MANLNPLYDVKISIRSSVKLLKEMKGKLESKPNRESLFRSTAFGPWLDVPYASNDSLLMHYVLQHQFGLIEFCLITGFRFGNVVTPKGRKDSPFSDRVFPEKKSMAVKSVKGTDLLKLLRGDRWLSLSDDDAVRVCLLIACELVFMGREDRNVIPNHIMALVEHFHEWNIWILETFPKSSNRWVKNLNVIPRGIAWTKVATFGKSDYSTIFGQDMNPTVDLFPTLKEMREPWFIASVNFIEGLLDQDTNLSQGQTEGGGDDQIDGDVDDECVDSGVVEKGHVDDRKDEDSVHGHGDGEEAVHASIVVQSDGVDGVNEPNNSNLASNFSMADLFQQINDCKRRLALMENRGSRMMVVVAEVEEIKSKIEKLEGFFNVDAKTEDVVNKSNVEPKHFEQTDDGSYVNTLTSHLPPHQSPRCSKAADQNDPTAASTLSLASFGLLGSVGNYVYVGVDSGVVEKGHVDDRKDEDSVHGHGDGEEAVHASIVVQSDGVDGKGHVDDRKDEDSVHGHGDGEEAVHASIVVQSDGVDGVNEPNNSNLASNFSMADLFQQINDCKRRLALMENRGSRMMVVVAEVEEIKSKIEKLEGFFNVDAKTEDVVNKSNVEPKHSEQTDDGSYVNTLTSQLPPHQSPRCSKASDQNDPTTTVSPAHPDDCELLHEPVKLMEIDQEDGKTTVSPAGKDNGPDVSEPVKPMEIDPKDGKFLIRSPDAPAFDTYPPVVVAAQSLLNLNKDQTVSNAEEGHFTDQYLNLDNADKNADEFSLDDIMEGEYIHDKDGNTEGFAAEMVVPGCNPVNKQDILVPNQDSENQTVNREYVNVVKPNQKPCLSKVFAPVIGKQMKKKTTSPNPVEQPSNAPRIPKTRSMMVKAAVLSPMVAEEKVVISPKPVPNFHKPVTRSSKTSITSLEPFQEDLSRPNARTTVNVPEHIRMFLKEIKPSKYWFPWGRCDIHVDRRFWLALAGLDTFKKGWLTDNLAYFILNAQHLDLWVDLLWRFRPNEADWAVVSPHFSQAILAGVFPTYYSNGVRYPVPWKDVERVHKHWILAELHIATGVVTFYDSLGLVKSSRRSCWRAMKKDLPLRLISYLNECGVLKSKGICIDTYDISYDFARVPVQGGLFGDCGVWVCICLYRLCRNEQLEVKDPVQAALAYRERMLDYYFDNKVETK
ncbi:phospholipase-like protein [Artemisia annua]|uniref:Phospholipase-like protein n=1 Tax=Artemisia annua TaxID=35608 RepID=A0A2U1MPW6_ARTAN|nr:phospholipase-like protein [Artemisia annua]